MGQKPGQDRGEGQTAQAHAQTRAHVQAGRQPQPGRDAANQGAIYAQEQRAILGGTPPIAGIEGFHLQLVIQVVSLAAQLAQGPQISAQDVRRGQVRQLVRGGQGFGLAQKPRFFPLGQGRVPAALLHVGQKLLQVGLSAEIERYGLTPGPILLQPRLDVAHIRPDFRQPRFFARNQLQTFAILSAPPGQSGQKLVHFQKHGVGRRYGQAGLKLVQAGLKTGGLGGVVLLPRLDLLQTGRIVELKVPALQVRQVAQGFFQAAPLLPQGEQALRGLEFALLGV